MTTKITSKTDSTPASSMEELMNRQKQKVSNFPILHKGDIIEGVITKLTLNEIIVDIHAKSDAIVLEKERKIARSMMETFAVGDKVMAQILSPESELGYPVVSLRRFLDEAMWKKIANVQKNGEKFKVHVLNLTKGGYLVETPFGVDAFLPNSHLLNNKDTNLTGKTIEVMVVEQNREMRKLILSQKPVLQQEDFDKIILAVKPGTKIDAVVTHITPFGIFCNTIIKIGDKEFLLDGFVHVSEVSWEHVSDLNILFENGQAIEASVLRIDTKTKRIELSIKQLTSDPFQENIKDFPIDKKIKATIVKMLDAGVHVNLGEDLIEGFIRKEKIPPLTTYKEGEVIDVTVIEHDSKKHRIYVAPVLLSKPLMYR